MAQDEGGPLFSLESCGAGIGIAFDGSDLRSGPMTFTTGEILALVAIGFVLAVIVAAYMIISRKKGWM